MISEVLTETVLGPLIDSFIRNNSFNTYTLHYSTDARPTFTAHVVLAECNDKYFVFFVLLVAASSDLHSNNLALHTFYLYLLLNEVLHNC